MVAMQAIGITVSQSDVFPPSDRWTARHVLLPKQTSTESHSTFCTIAVFLSFDHSDVRTVTTYHTISIVFNGIHNPAFANSTGSKMFNTSKTSR